MNKTKKMNLLFIFSFAIAITASIFVTLYHSEGTPVKMMEGNNAYDDSSNMIIFLALFIPFWISRIFLLNRGISIIEAFYFPVAVIAGCFIVESVSSYTLVSSIIKTLEFGMLKDKLGIVIFILSLAIFFYSYFVLIIKGISGLKNIYSSG